MNQPIRLQGLIPACFTPMHPDQSLNLNAIPAYAAHLRQHHPAALFINGTTGEFSSLTTDQRITLAQHWHQACPDIPLIIHVGHNALDDARTLAEHAQQLGVFGIAALAPHFFRPSDVHALVDFMAAVAKAAPQLRFYCYHIPVLTGVHLSCADFLQAAESRIPNLAGIKFTHENLLDMQNAIHIADGRWQIMFGRDEILLAGLSLGCTAAVGSTYNYLSPLFQQIITNFHTGQLAQAQHAQQLAVECINLLVKYPSAANKAIMSMLVHDVGPVRLAQSNLTNSQFASLRLDLLRWLENVRTTGFSLPTSLG